MAKTLTFKVLDTGKLPQGIRETLAALFPVYAGKVIKLSISESKKYRSNPQNRFWFGAMIPAIKEWFMEHGHNFSAEEIHEYMVKRVWKHTQIVLIENEPYERRLSSADLSTIEWEKYMDITRHWGAERGLILPFPHEHFERNEDEAINHEGIE